MTNPRMEKLDSEAYKLLLTLPKLPFGRLIRPDHTSVTKAKAAFLSEGTLPSFTYSKAKAFDTESYRKKLYIVKGEIEALNLEETVKGLYLSKLTEIGVRLSIVEAIKKGDDEAVTKASLELFGLPASPALTLQKEFEAQLSRAEKGHLHLHAPRIGTSAFVNMVQATLDHYGLTNWRIKLYPRSSIRVGHAKRGRPPVIRIPKNLSLTKRRARRLLTHEIEVHALRTDNGEQSPLHLLGRGLAGYLKTEEGLAVWYQHLVSRKSIEHVPGFWEAWTAALLLENGFSETFHILKEARTKLAVLMGDHHAEAKGESAAWNLLMRFSRGITAPKEKGIGFFKDHIYRDGFLRVDALHKAEGQEALNQLFLGNFDINDLPVLQKLDLPKPRIPDLIAESIVKSKMKKDIPT
jgi:hypothetical protein